MGLKTLFNSKRALLLQGPVGPFFNRLAGLLKEKGIKTYKVNFNAGDWVYYPSAHLNYQGSLEAWPSTLAGLLDDLGIDSVTVFGDCRAYHSAAREICKAKGIPFLVFEEGYLRPDYITLEQQGVNGFSTVPRSPSAFDAYPEAYPEPEPVAAFPRHAIWAAMQYYVMMRMAWPLFPNYRHHKHAGLLNYIIKGCKMWVNKHVDAYLKTSHRVQRLCETRWKQSYFLVPLQVHNDSQITFHSDFNSVQDFILEVLSSFSADAPREARLIFKHHPLDVGFRDYRTVISTTAKSLGLGDRVHYVKGGHTPSLLRNAKGVVVINSTTGLSALHHMIPVKVLGRANYDIQGLTCQSDLGEFWSNPGEVDEGLYKRLRNHLTQTSQINGSFYADWPTTKAGIQLLQEASAAKA
jgi:capsular polysaccharide export protein